MLGLYLVGVGASTTRMVGANIVRPRRYLKKLFLLSYFSVTKSTKSHIRGLSSLLKISSRVHELVARSSAWRARVAKDRAKVGSFAALRNLILPRVRTYHTKKPSRFVHALSARPLKKGGAGVNKVSALTEVTISLLQWGIDRFAQANAVGVAETGAEGGAVYRDG